MGRGDKVLVEAAGQSRGKIVVVGGPGRNAGKTTLVCALIRALRERQWVAAKITADDHGQPAPLWEETRQSGKGTGRFLAAGAERAFLLTSNRDAMPMAEFWEAAGADANVIFESNRIAEELQPDLCLAVIGAGEECKPSFAPFLRRADALLVSREASSPPPLAAGQRLFRGEPLEPLSDELLAWARSVLRF